MRCRDHKDFPDAGQHQRRDRVIDHRLIINGSQLLADSHCHGMEAATRTTG